MKKEHTSADEENSENGEPPAPYVPPENTYTPRRRTSTYNCTQCIKKYLSQDGLDTHILWEHNMYQEDVPPPPPPTYQPRRRTSTVNCTQCTKKYLSQDGVDAHVVKEHGGNSGDTLQPVDVTNLSSNQSNTYTPRRKTSTFNCTQ